jgi:hypothetical protein
MNKHKLFVISLFLSHRLIYYYIKLELEITSQNLSDQNLTDAPDQNLVDAPDQAWVGVLGLD